eukprot:TRINITY_DN1458_c0_g2_i4.p1 TRINITY_DN1458_c0_g2~~TRINITY_DN1458_c0_g2_i4.p1  ORF type:complete len:537 (-),score=81.79 TRINITY_DN1458_c0_g2_i4:646-2118(-)
MNNQKQYLTTCMLLNIFVQCVSQSSLPQRSYIQSQNNNAKTFSAPAQSGVFTNWKNVSDIFVIQNNTAKSNKASSISGDARSGVSNFIDSVLDGDSSSSVQGTYLGLYNYAEGNRGVSQTDSAVSGEQSIFRQIQDSIVLSRGDARNNTAAVLGAPNISAVSGIDLQVKNITKEQEDSFGSTLVTLNNAYSNDATNAFQGKGIAGVASSVGYLHYSDASLSNVAQHNTAFALKGTAVGGAQNNVLALNTSQILLNSTSSDNTVTSEGGDAVAGVQNNIGAINGVYGFYFSPTPLSNGTYLQGTNFTVPSLITQDRAKGNVAISRDDGKAIAGVQTNIDSLSNGQVVMESYSVKNRATTFGEGDEPQDAVAGVAVNFNSVNNSDIDVLAFSQNNIALNYNKDPTYNSHAIAGVGVLIGWMQNSSLSMVAESIGNHAYASHGDAIAGNRMQVVNNLGANSLLPPQFLSAQRNSANATNGHSVVTNSLINITP